MNAEEYSNLERVEREHWYYAGKRELVRGWLERLGVLKAECRLLDAGAGTGFFARELRGRCRVQVLDDHPESLAILRQHFTPEEIVDGTIRSERLKPASYDAITAMDVVEHVEHDAEMVRAIHTLLKPGGVAVVTAPASMALWSDWDVVLHHYRRYSLESFKKLFADAGWEVLDARYTNGVVYPAVWLVRKWRTLRQKMGAPTDARTEDRLPPAWMNQLLKATFVGTGRSWLRSPFGVSVLLVARKR
ncbi:MAG: class I SAM-dependent methyltransferase [Verrucomicrobiota bacterium]